MNNTYSLPLQFVDNNFLFIISAPSGTGKTTVCKHLLQKYNDLVLSISATTRAPRPQEKNGISYFFLQKDEFKNKRDNGDFLETVERFGNYYGTPIKFVQEQINNRKNVLFDIDWHGAKSIKEKNKFNIVSLFLIPPSIDVLRARLQKRDNNDKQTEDRINGFREDAERADDFDYVIINDDLEKTCLCIEDIYRTSKLKFQKKSVISFIDDILIK